jgi:hypothetical protein
LDCQFRVKDCTFALHIPHDMAFLSITLCLHGKKIPTIADEKSTKSLSNFENKQPKCTIMFIFVFSIAFVQNCRFLSTLASIPTKIGDRQQKTYFLQNAQHFLSVNCPKLSLFFTL